VRYALDQALPDVSLASMQDGVVMKNPLA